MGVSRQQVLLLSALAIFFFASGNFASAADYKIGGGYRLRTDVSPVECPDPNPITGFCTCPSGFTADRFAKPNGSGGSDGDLYMCKQSVSYTQGWQGGYMQRKNDGNCIQGNPLNGGACSCPAGTKDEIVADVEGPGDSANWIRACTKNGVLFTGSDRSSYGGMYHTRSSCDLVVNNALAGGICGCPAGYTNYRLTKVTGSQGSAGEIRLCYFDSTQPQPSNYTLSVTKSGSGNGTVLSSPASILCGTSCSASFTSGINVTLSATVASGSTFAGWSGGGCSGTGTCTVTMNANKTVTATFTSAAPSTGTIQGVVFDKNNPTQGVAARVSAAGQSSNVVYPYTYTFNGITAQNQTVTISNIQSGFASPEYNICPPNQTGTCHSSQPWVAGSSAQVTVPAGGFVDLYWRVSQSSQQNPPIVVLNANPSTVAPGGSSMLSWTAQNATNCTASASPSSSRWTGSKPTSGSSYSTGPLNADIKYILTCTGPGGQGSDNADVNVRIPTPVINLSTVCNAGAPSAVLSWGAIAGADDYSIYRTRCTIGSGKTSCNPSTPSHPSDLIGTVQGLSYTDNNVVAGTYTYAYRVRANDTATGPSLYSNEVSNTFVCNATTGSIHGQVFDAEDNGIGVETTVQIIETGEEYYTLADSEPDPPGWYDFSDLDAGTYRVAIPEMPDGYTSVEYSFCSVASETTAPPDPCGVWRSGGANRTATVTVPAGGYVNLNWRLTPVVQTGTVVIKRVDGDNFPNPISGTQAWIDPTSKIDGNPATFDVAINSIDDTYQVAYSTKLAGKGVSVGICDYAQGGPECRLDNPDDDYSPLTCDADCSVGIEISPNRTTKVVFKYGIDLDISCTAVPASIHPDETVRWTAFPIGGSGSFDFEWEFSNEAVSFDNPADITYDISDIVNNPQTARVTVTDRISLESVTQDCTTDVTVTLGGGKGDLEVKWVGSDERPASAPDGVNVKIGSGPLHSSPNPYTESNLDEGSYTAHATDLDGYVITAGVCTTENMNGCDSIDSFDIVPDCSGGYCSVDADVVAGEKTRVVFLYETDLTDINAACRLVPSDPYMIGKPVSWFAVVPESEDIYTYKWDIPDGDIISADDEANVTATFSDTGTKTASVTITSLLQNGNTIILNNCTPVTIANSGEHGFDAEDINHDPRCKLPNGSSTRGVCVEHAFCPGPGVHAKYDIRVPIRPGTRLSSTYTTITVTPEPGFTKKIKFSLDRVEADAEKNAEGIAIGNNCGDGSGVNLHGIRFIFNTGADVFRDEITIGPSYPASFQFRVNILPETAPGRYIIYLKAQAADGSGVPVIEPILLILGEKTGGYFDEI